MGHAGKAPAVCRPAAPERELLSLRGRVFLSVCGVPDQEAAGAGQNGVYLRAGDSRNIFLSNAARYQVFIAVSRSGETEQVLDKARIAKNVGMTIVAFTRASANTLAGMADVHFALYDEAVHFAAEAAGVTSFESNLVLLMDLLLLEATG